MYNSVEEAKACGVSEADLVLLDRRINTFEDMRKVIPKLEFPKNKSFGRIRNLVSKD